MKDKVSCIIPCYDCGKYLAEAIDSAMNQTVLPLEIILVYDHSSDNTWDVIVEKKKEYEEYIVVIVSEEKRGPSFARNLAIGQAKGDYLLFLDADDLLFVDSLEQHLVNLQKLNAKGDLQYILSYSSYLQVDESAKHNLGISKGREFVPGEGLGYSFVRNFLMSPSGVLAERETVIKAGKFNNAIFVSEDWDLWLRLAQHGGFAYIDEPLIKLRRHEDNLSGSLNRMINAEREILLQYSLEYIKEAIYKRKLDIEQNHTDYISILFKLEKYRELKELLFLLIKEENKHYNLYFYLGLYNWHTNDNQAATEAFKKVLEIKKEHAAAMNNIGALLLLDDKKEEARGYFEQALILHPSYMDANHNDSLIDQEKIEVQDVKITKRELRSTLTSYTSY